MYILNDKDGVLLVMLDLSAVFDTLDHVILLYRLEDSVGVKSATLRLFESYLTDRHQSVHITSTMQSERRSKSEQGFARGRVVSPCSFWYLIEGHCTSRHGYADDSQLYTSLYLKYPEQVQAAVHRVEQCLVDVKSWMADNKLKLNDSKIEALVVVRKQQRHYVQNIKVTGDDSERVS